MNKFVKSFTLASGFKFTNQHSLSFRSTNLLVFSGPTRDPVAHRVDGV